MKVKENILLADCVPKEVRPLAEKLSIGANGFVIRSHIANWKRTGKLSELRRYFTYFAVAFRYFITRERYGAIVGWQQFYVLIFCFYCSIFRVKKTNTVLALNFTYKKKSGRMAGLYRWFMGGCLSPEYMDCIHVPSGNYADQITEEFGFPRSRIIVSHFGVDDRSDYLSGLPAPADSPEGGYALAIGRSNRDYDFLIRAWRGMKLPLVIISDTYRGRCDDPNIKIISDVAGEASEPWIANCSLMVIPIDDGSICSGDTVLLTAMSAGRKIIVTCPSTLAEMYIEDGVNAVLSPKDETVFRAAAEKTLYDEAYALLGERAKVSFIKKYTIASMGERISQALNTQTRENTCSPYAHGIGE